MTERTQRFLWTFLAVTALGLIVATGWLFLRSRQMATASASEPYRIVYMDMQAEEHARLMSCNLHGKDVRPLTDGQKLDGWPVAASLREGEQARIAFLRVDLQEPDWGVETMPGGVYVVDASGGEPTRVQSTVRSISLVPPTWSPSGDRLAFGGAEDLNGDRNLGLDEIGVYVCDVATQQTQRVATAVVEGSHLAWSPVGDWGLVPMRRSNLPAVSLLDVSSDKLTLILDGKASLACWSPDGTYCAAYAPDGHKVHLLPNAGGQPYSIDAPPGEVIDLAWAPMPDAGTDVFQGRLLAVAARQASYGVGQLYTRSANPRAREAWEPLTDAQTHIFGLAVSPDGRYVAYSLATGGPTVGRDGRPSADLYLLELGQPEPRQLTSDAGFEGMATWAPTGK